MAAQQEQPTITAIGLSSSKKAYQEFFSSYLGISFAIFLGFLPKSSISYISNLQSHNRALSLKLFQAEEQLKEMLSRRKEDSKANARVVEIFASHRNGWQVEEKRLIHQIDTGEEEIARLKKLEEELKGKVEELTKEVNEREEMLNFVTRGREEDEFEDTDAAGAGGGYGGGDDGEEYYGEVGSRIGKVRVSDEESMEEYNNHNVNELGGLYGRINGFTSLISNTGSRNNNGFDSEFSNSGSKFWGERASLWQDVQYEPAESAYDMKHYVARRESPWKVDGDSSGVSSKLKLLENELLNLERMVTSNPTKIPSLMRKQAKRYQALAGKIDDLCRRMQESDPCEPNISPEFRTQRQTEFLLEAFRLQQRASETAQKLTALQTETGQGYFGDELESHAKLATMRSVFSLKNNFREIQRNLEIWLARIIGRNSGQRWRITCKGLLYISISFYSIEGTISN